MAGSTSEARHTFERDSKMSHGNVSSSFYWRKWIETNRAESHDTMIHGFSLMTYNILTDKAIPDEFYQYCPKEIRYLNSRHPRIMKEVVHYNPDIICFQEVAVHHYLNFMEPDLGALGYRGVHHHRSDDCGMATFYKSELFQLQTENHCVLSHLMENILQVSKISPGIRTAIRKLINRPHALLLTKLRHKISGDTLNLANIHVLWGELKQPDVQTLQIACALQELMEFSGGPDKPHIICGDFNTPPDFAAYGLLKDGYLTTQNREKLEHSVNIIPSDGEAETMVNVLPASAFSHQTKLKSAYFEVMGQEPDITNCDDGAQDYLTKLCLDYIWFSASSIDVLATLEAPAVEAILRHTGLPSVLFPSDHVPIMSKFLIRTSDKQ